MNAATPTPRREWPILLGITLVGALARLWGLHRLGLSHFDEGMYAMAAFWVAQPTGFAGIDPSASLYAPPVFHLLNGFSYLLLGYGDLPLILPSLVAGVAVIPLAAWIARRAFGPGAAVAAAALAALSGADVAFSRMALTDSLFLATWLLAMAAGLRFLERPGVGRALLLGLAVGLAQNTKYNGWLSGVVVGVAGLLGMWPEMPSDRRANRRILLGLAIAAVVSALCYLPWFRWVEAHGSYAALMDHQRGYLGRISDWPAHLRLQLGAITALSGGVWWLSAAWGLAVLGIGLVLRERPSAARVVSLAAAGVVFVALPSSAWWLGMAWLPWLLWRAPAASRLLGVWWLLLSVLTPAYHPYARLWLPLHALGWILGGGLLAELFSGREPGTTRAIPVQRRGVALGCAGLGVAAVLLAFVPRPARPLGGLLAPSDFFRREVLPSPMLSRNSGAEILKVLARPHAAYYLFLDDSAASFQKVGSLDQAIAEVAPGAWLLVDEAQLREAGDLRTSLARIESVYEQVPGPPLVETLNPVTLLDVVPEAAFGEDAARHCRWLVFRPRPPSASAPR